MENTSDKPSHELRTNTHSKPSHELRTPFVATFFDRMCLSPRTNAELEWWAQELLRWAERDDSLVLYEFAAIMGISNKRFAHFAKKSEALNEALEVAKALIGARREKLALKNEFNASLVIKTMANYNEEYANYERDLKMLGSEGDKAQTINVVMPPMPESPLVPKKTKKKKE